MESDGGCGTKVFMNYFDNPGGMIPTWLVNWAAKKGVPGFLTDMQEACSNYSNYCQNKWTQLTDNGSRTRAQFHFSCFNLGRYSEAEWLNMTCLYGVNVAQCGLLLVVVACCWLRHDVHDRPLSLSGWCQINSVSLYCINQYSIVFLCNHSKLQSPRDLGAFIGYLSFFNIYTKHSVVLLL